MVYKIHIPTVIIIVFDLPPRNLWGNGIYYIVRHGAVYIAIYNIEYKYNYVYI